MFGPDRSGIYGGAQGIGGMETTYAENGQATYGILKNFFGDHLGNLNTLGLYAWSEVLGGYGAMPGFSVNTDLVPQWRGHYLDWTGFYYMGARYYDPESGRFLSADPLGHDASLSLYDYCDGDPVNGLDPDGRCVEKGEEIARNAEDNISYNWRLAYYETDPVFKRRFYRGLYSTILSGDAFIHYTTPMERLIENGSMPSAYFCNGIWFDRAHANEIETAIAEGLDLDQRQVFSIQNPSVYKMGDIIRAFFHETGAIDITAIRAADMLSASRGGYFISHSNGSEVFRGAVALLPFEVRSHINYEGFGPQIYIDEQNIPGLNSYYNEAGEHDAVPMLLNFWRHPYWDKIIPQQGYNLEGNHNFIRIYLPDVHPIN
ncbi:MAG: RHS repeat-associated core domain-containing protein [Chthoniobacterales bacterium]|nr:RHS repeat-associated core domain-containing protein [Chthoniobacterales bacterium]